MDLIPGSGDSLEEEMETFFSTLSGEILLPEEPGGLHFMGSQGVGHDWATEQTLIGKKKKKHKK